MEVVRTSFLESRESEFGDFGLRKQYIDFGIENIARKCRDFDILVAQNCCVELTVSFESINGGGTKVEKRRHSV